MLTFEQRHNKFFPLHFIGSLLLLPSFVPLHQRFLNRQEQSKDSIHKGHWQFDIFLRDEQVDDLNYFHIKPLIFDHFGNQVLMRRVGVDSVDEGWVILFEVGVAHAIGGEQIDSIKYLIIGFPVALLFLILGKPLLILRSELLQVAIGEDDMLFEIVIHVLEFFIIFVGLTE